MLNAAETLSPELEIARDIAGYARDPLGFVYYAFPWGQGELKEYDGPDAWQIDILNQIKSALECAEDPSKALQTAIQIAVSSGHGIGKSALVSWVILWALSTFEDTKGVVTANTENQLRTKTWAELAKWFRLCVTAPWFKYSATSIASNDPGHEKTWRIDSIPWSEHNTEAFAGLHNQGRRIVVIFDEASAIADVIWEVTEGALTDKDTEILWFAFGNPTRATGRFHACFHKYRHRWINKQIDARTVKITNKVQIKAWQDDYGEDSDFFRVRVRGVFPNTSDRQFIPSSYVEQARGKHLDERAFGHAPIILGVDPAIYGDDECVIYLRQGPIAKQLAVYRKVQDDFTIAGYVAKLEKDHNADAVFVDMGYGTGIVSAGRQMNRHWILVPFAGEATDPGYLNKRAEMWGNTKDWLKEGGAIPDDPILCDELTGPEYFVNLRGKIQLESKDDMKKRGLSSPNRADALALTFAFPVLPKSKRGEQGNFVRGQKEYNPFG